MTKEIIAPNVQNNDLHQPRKPKAENVDDGANDRLALEQLETQMRSSGKPETGKDNVNKDDVDTSEYTVNRITGTFERKRKTNYLVWLSWYRSADDSLKAPERPPPTHILKYWGSIGNWEMLQALEKADYNGRSLCWRAQNGKCPTKSSITNTLPLGMVDEPVPQGDDNRMKIT